MDQLEAAFASSDPEVRAYSLEQAASLLRTRLPAGELERVARVLEQALTDWSDSVRVALASAVAYLNHGAWGKIAGVLAKDGNAYVRRAAAATLAQRTRSQERQLEEKIDQVLGEIEALSRTHSPQLAARVRRLGRAYFTYTMSGVTHEARAILTGLKRSLTSTERELTGGRKGPPRPWTQFRERTERRIQTLEKILSDAKDFASQAPKETQRTGVHELVTEALELVRDQFLEHKGAPRVEVSLDVDRNLEVMVPRHRLSQALGNVLRNAYEAIESAGTITITASATVDRVTVRVDDTGCGISEEDLAIVFVGSRSTKKGRRGPVENTGWGLTVAQGAVEDCGGKIWIESEEGKGASVFVELPRAHPDADPGDDDEEDDFEAEEEEESP